MPPARSLRPAPWLRPQAAGRRGDDGRESGVDLLEGPAGGGRHRAVAEQPDAAVGGVRRKREPCVAPYVREPLQHGGGRRDERRLQLWARVGGRGAEPDQRELGEPDRLVVTVPDRLDVALQLTDGGAGREVPAVQ